MRFEIADCGLQIEKHDTSQEGLYEASICNLHSETGNPPEGWESGGQLWIVDFRLENADFRLKSSVTRGKECNLKFCLWRFTPEHH